MKLSLSQLRHQGSRTLPSLCMGVLLLATTGCHSAFIEATLINHSGQTVRLLEMDYPSASFGTESLPPEASFHYRFKIIGEGPLKLSWTDPQQKEHSVQGPRLHEGQQGLLTVTMGPEQLAWQTTFR